MADQVKRFEISILRPLQIAFLVLGVALALKGMWLWLVAPVGSLFYLGIVGAKLHPLQSATALAQGPLDTPAARVESELSPSGVKLKLVADACTRTALLVGAACGVALWAGAGLSWYFAVPVAFVTIVLVGALLKLIFAAV